MFKTPQKILTKNFRIKMASGTGNKTNTSQELVMYEPTTWDLVYTGEEVNRPSTTVCNPPAWLPNSSRPFKRQKKMSDF
jgi:hypothetical protein